MNWIFWRFFLMFHVVYLSGWAHNTLFFNLHCSGFCKKINWFFLSLPHVSGFNYKEIPRLNRHITLPNLVLNHAVCSICLICSWRSGGMGATAWYGVGLHFIPVNNHSLSHIYVNMQMVRVEMEPVDNFA